MCVTVSGAKVATLFINTGRKRKKNKRKFDDMTKGVLLVFYFVIIMILLFNNTDYHKRIIESIVAYKEEREAQCSCSSC